MSVGAVQECDFAAQNALVRSYARSRAMINVYLYISLADVQSYAYAYAVAALTVTSIHVAHFQC